MTNSNKVEEFYIYFVHHGSTFLAIVTSCFILFGQNDLKQFKILAFLNYITTIARCKI